MRLALGLSLLLAGCGDDGRISPIPSGGLDASAPDGADMACPPGPDTQDAPADPHPIYPEPAFIHVERLGAAVQTACVTGAPALVEGLLPELLGSLTRVDPGCGCDFAITFAPSAPMLPADAAAAWAMAGTTAERYVAVTASDRGRATATLYAPDDRGALYALRAAMAQVEQGRAANAIVVDWPVFAVRGVVEGFYGQPYSVTDRTTILRLMSRLRENVFVYGPKDDPYARAQWRDPYPMSGEAQVIQVAAHEADKNGIEFIWSISPGLDFDFNNFDAEVATLNAKIENVRGLGVRKFALFLDDISNADAAGHARLINAVDDHVKSTDAAARLLVVGTRYAFGPNAYTDTLGQMVDDTVDIMWTGNDIEPATMTAADMTAVNASLRRQVTIWDNWPNAPGSFEGRSADLHTAVAGYYTNPVLNELQAHPTVTFLQVLGPISDYLWSPERYAASASYTRWQPILGAWNQQVAPCTPCGSFVQGWTCATTQTAIEYCDGSCLTTLPCPGGCQFQPNPHPDICR